ncbi:MAG TPA: class I SAM-dependent methyltransferase [Gemmatimonadaceae bacterium]
MTDEYAGAAEFYDYVVPYATRGDVEFYVDEALAANGPVLELGCGTGRVLIPIARAGVTIHGLDGSPTMLARCMEKLEAEPANVRSRVALHQGDMRSFKLQKQFSLITIPFRPFQHLLMVEDQLDCLRCIHSHLVDDGRMILDLFNPSLDMLVNRPLGVEMIEGPPFEMPDGRSVTRSFKVSNPDRFEQINDIEMIYNVTHKDGRTERQVHAFRMRYFFRYEAEHLLARAGFAVEQLYAGYDRSAYGSTYPGELIFIARKVA